MTISNTHTLLSVMPFGERMTFGLQVFVVGMLTVFAVLAILWLVLELFRIFFYEIPRKRKAAEKAEPANQAPEKAAEPAVAAAPAAADDSELIAVITAAIEAYNSQNGSALPFRVVSYRRVTGANGWNKADTNQTI